LAPEVIESHTYVESADIWSVGMIAYHLSEGNIPNDKLHPIKIMYNIINNPSPKISSRRT
jgi:serine/threonine protein kinase